MWKCECSRAIAIANRGFNLTLPSILTTLGAHGMEWSGLTADRRRFFAGRQRKTNKLPRLQTIVTRSSVARCRSRSSELARSATNEASSHRLKMPVGRPELQQRRTQEDVPEGEPIGLTMGLVEIPLREARCFLLRSGSPRSARWRLARGK